MGTTDCPEWSLAAGEIVPLDRLSVQSRRATPLDGVVPAADVTYEDLYRATDVHPPSCDGFRADCGKYRGNTLFRKEHR